MNRVSCPLIAYRIQGLKETFLVNVMGVMAHPGPRYRKIESLRVEVRFSTPNPDFFIDINWNFYTT